MARSMVGSDPASSLIQYKCPYCGTVGVETQRFCPQCGANTTQQKDEAEKLSDEAVSERLDERDTDVQDAEATIRVNVRNPRDPDATVLASQVLSSELFKKAIERSREKGAEQLSSPETQTKGDAQQFVETARKKRHSRKRTLLLTGSVACVLLVLALLTTVFLNHNGEVSAQQKAQQSKAQLDSQLQEARAEGVPASYLQPILTQEQQLQRTEPLLTAVNPFAPGYYMHAAQQYHALAQQIPAIIATATSDLQTQAQQDMQAFQTAISRLLPRSMRNSRYFSQQFSQNQLALASAHSPADYCAISQNVQKVITALEAMGIVYTQLNDLQTTIHRMAMAHLDVTALQMQYENDLHLFDNATTTSDFQNLGSQIDVQYEQTVVASIEAFPYIGVTKLNELQQQINQLHSYGINTSNYQQRLGADQIAEQHVNTVYDALLFIKQVDNDISSMYSDLMKREARYLVEAFHQQVAAWANAHPYYDSYDGHTYALDDGYMANGIGNTLDSDLAAATTTADYAAIVNEANNDLFDLHMFEADYSDHTLYNRVHATDLQMLNHYNLQGKLVLMVSLSEQVMRVYSSGKLVRAFYVTTGRAELPSPPGVWNILDRRSPATFVSGEPKTSPYWFPPTPIQYAILYHYGGDFIHDAWWRQSFGPGTQFPHADVGGNTSYNFDGSHGCINLTSTDAAWVYKNTDWSAIIVVY